MAEQAHPDLFAPLIPAAAARMRVAWDALQVPAPPPAFALSAQERQAVDPQARFHRRTIQLLDCAGPLGDRLALVDKAIPHGRFDLMLSETSAAAKSTPLDVAPATGRALWRSGLEWVRFVSDPAQQEHFGLAGGEVQLALNCDPYTRDRPSVQAAKQFHLHLLYWTADELAALQAAPARRLADESCPRRRRQCLDPLGFAGPRLLAEMLADLDSGIPGAGLLAFDPAAVIAGAAPLGCVLRLPGWEVLGQPAFEALIRRLHLRLAAGAARLLEAFTGHDRPPPVWRRYGLLSLAEVRARLRWQGWSPESTETLLMLAAVLRDLSPRGAERLRRAGTAASAHCMTLNQPCYTLNLCAPAANRPGDRAAAEAPVLLVIQLRLFSGIGGAGLLGLGGIPSVRVVRGRGTFSATDWHRRAAFQRAFALHNAAALAADPDLDCAPGCARVRRLLDFHRGWV